jgi:hypothetical protein
MSSSTGFEESEMSRNKEYETVRGGDTAPLVDKGGSLSGDFSNSLGDASRSDLVKGYTDMGSIKSNTKSDKPRDFS